MANGTSGNTEFIGSAAGFRPHRSVYREIIDTLTVGVIILESGSLRILEVNRAASEIVGVSTARLVDAEFGAAGIFRESADAAALLRGLRSGASARASFTLSDGTVAKFNATAAETVSGEIISCQIERFAERAETAANRQTRDAMHRLAVIIESARTAVITTDAAGIIDGWNSSAELLFGYTPDEAVGRSIKLLTPLDLGWEDDVLFRALARGEKLENFETVRQRKNGERVAIALTIARIATGEGETGGGVAFLAHDISGRRRVEEDNRKLLKELTDLRFAIDSSTIVAINDQRGRFTFVNDRFCSFFGFTREELIGRDHSLIRAGTHPQEYFDEIERTIRSGQVWHGEIRDRTKDGSFVWVDATIVPFLDERGEPYQYIALYHDITELKRIEGGIQESGRRMRLATEATGLGIWEWHVDSNRIIWDDQMFHIYGVEPTPDGFVDYEVWRSAVHPDEISLQEEMLQTTVRRAGQSRREFRIRRAGESDYRNIQSVEAVRLDADGNVEWVVGTNVDITDRKRAVRNLIRSEETFRSLVEATSQVIYRVNPEGTVISAIDWAALVGVKISEGDARVEWQSIVHPEDVQETMRKWDLAIAAGEIFESEFRLMHGDGTYHHYVSRAVPIFENRRVREWIGAISDVTGERLAVAGLRESEERFRQLAEGLPLLVWTCRGEDGSCDYLSPQWLRYTGISDEHQLGFGWLESAHPDDRAELISLWKEAVANGGEFLGEFRIRRSDGKYRWFQTQALPIRGADGEILKWFGTNTDIDDRKRTEAFASTLAALSEFLVQNSDSDEILAFLGERTREFVGVTSCSLVTIDEGDEFLDVTHQWSADPKFHHVGRFRLADGVMPSYVEALRNGETVIVSDVREDERIARPEEFERIGIRSIVIVPLIGESHWLSFLSAGREGGGEWGRDVIDFFTEAGARIWNHLERRRVQRELRAEQDRLERIAEASPSAICSIRPVADVAGGVGFRFEFVSPAIEPMCGFSVEQVLADASGLFGRTNPEDQARMRDGIARSIAGMKIHNDAFRYEHPTKGEIWLECFMAPVEESGGGLIFHGIFNDITERKKSEQALAESEKRYRLLFMSNPLPMWVYDLQTLRILAVNDAAVYHYGFSRAEFLAMTIRDIRPPEDLPDLYDTLVSTHQAFNNAGRFRHRRKDESVIDVEIVSHGIEFDGRIARIVLANDVTERIKAERTVLELNETLEQKVAERTAELNNVNRELESFSYSVSHDLRAPLRAMDGFSLALLEDYESMLDETGRNYLERIRSASQKMAQLIDDLLKLSRMSRGELHRSTVNISRIVGQITDQLQEYQPKESVEVKIAKDVRAVADERLIRVALENLLGNAWKFTSRTASAKITFGTRTIDGERVCYVSDNGAGFDMNYADKLFGAFQRLHNSKEFEGTGIGLATVQRIIHRHGGRIWAESRPNEGATFYFTFG